MFQLLEFAVGARMYCIGERTSLAWPWTASSMPGTSSRPIMAMPRRRWDSTKYYKQGTLLLAEV